MSAKVALVLVSHSARLAAGVAELAKQMAPDVPILPCGGTENGTLGTSFDLVDAEIERAREASLGRGVAVLTDLGSATMTVESVIEFMAEDDEVFFADGPFVEGAVAAAACSQQGGSVIEVVDSVGQAGIMWMPAPGVDAAYGAFDSSGPNAGPSAEGSEYRRSVVIADQSGLHARPAARLARLASQFDASIKIDGANASSVIELMSLGKSQWDTVEVVAMGPDAEKAMHEVSEAIASGFDQ